MMILCMLITSELLYSRLCTVIIRCALRGTLLRCPVRPRVILIVHSSCFPLRTVLMMPFCRTSWSTSSCIVVMLVLPSSSPWTLLYFSGAGRWFHATMLIPTTTTADYGLHLPSLSTMPMFSGRCRSDVCFDVADDVVFLRHSARRRSRRRGDDLLCSCASPAVCWWTSPTPMMGLSSPASDRPRS